MLRSGACAGGEAIMPMNVIYQRLRRPAREHSGVPAGGRAAVAARADAAQHFRAALSRDDRRLAARRPPADRHDPARSRRIPAPTTSPTLFKVGCVGRITQIAESGDGRYLLQLTGVARFRVEQELKVATAYRQCRVTYQPFADDFIARKGEDEVDRKAVLEALTSFLKANNLKTDWQGVESAPNEALVNALAMMSPYGAAEKQALLEAPDLSRAPRS